MKHPRSLGLAFAAAFGAVLPAPAQEIKARAALIAAREAKALDPEGAARFLREAWGYAQNMPRSSKERRTFEAEVDRMLRDLDPTGPRLMKERHRAARDLERLLPDYAEANWKQTAFEIIDLIRTLDPQVEREKVDEVVTRFAAGEAAAVAAPASDTPTIMEWFGDAETMFREKPWLYSPDTIGSPPFSAAEWGLRPSALLVSNERLIGEMRVEIEILTGEQGKASFCWNLPGRGQGRKPYYIVSVEDVEKGKTLRLGLQKDAGWEQLGEPVLLEMDPLQRHDWVPLSIELRTDAIRVKAGAMEKPIEVLPDFEANGRPALLVPGDTGNRGGAYFRGLKIQRL